MIFFLTRFYLLNYETIYWSIVFSPQELEVSNTFETDIETRNMVLKEACKHYGLDVLGNDRLHKPYPWEYLIAKHKSANLVWCNVFKSGSSRYADLMYNF